MPNILTRSDNLITEYSPTDLNISGVNLKVTTPYPTGVLDFNSLAREFLLQFKFVAVGTVTVGTAKLQAETFMDDGVSILLPITDIITGIALPGTGATTYLNILASSYRAPRKVAGPAATIIANDSDLFSCVGKTRFTLVAITASDAVTSCVGSMFLRTHP